MAQPTNLLEAIRHFSDLDVATEYVAGLRWPDGFVCPHCGGRDYSYVSTRRLWKCKSCQKQSSVKVGTIFEDSALGLDKWLPAIWLAANPESADQLARARPGTRYDSEVGVVHAPPHRRSRGDLDRSARRRRAARGGRADRGDPTPPTGTDRRLLVAVAAVFFALGAVLRLARRPSRAAKKLLR